MHSNFKLVPKHNDSFFLHLKFYLLVVGVFRFFYFKRKTFLDCMFICMAASVRGFPPKRVRRLVNQQVPTIISLINSLLQENHECCCERYPNSWMHRLWWKTKSCRRLWGLRTLWVIILFNILLFWSWVSVCCYNRTAET